MLNYKIIFKYMFFNIKNFFFIKNNFFNKKNTLFFIKTNSFYYTILHIKLSSFFYSTQLLDLFAYEVPTKNANQNNNSSIIVYNFHSLKTQQHFFVFLKQNIINLQKNHLKKNNFVNSITELFLNANWLEREMIELHGILLINKKDLRNLLLPYGDTSAPMKKSYPSIGLREVFYNANTDLLTQLPVSIQF